MQEQNASSGEFLCAHDDVVERVTSYLPADEILYDLAELFKVFGDSEMCVGDIAQLLKLTQTAVSHQLRVLKNNKLVKFRREGKVVFYSLADDHVRSIIGQGMEHIGE